jgi:hypothetical protein
MSIPATNSKLLVTEDWKKIYQSYQNAEFQSYDFDTLRRILISYLQENYPEDFNDFIESSEYIALVDLIAYVGQNLSFRIDLNARENFLETAQRRDSILRLAQLVSYVPKRNVPASGLLKLSAVSTTANVYDQTGNNLSGSTIVWNDSTNINWYTQFISIIDNAMSGDLSFGMPYDSDVLNGVETQQYIINSSNVDVPVYAFDQNINGTSMHFEIVSSTFSGKNYIYEDPPKPGNAFKILYQNDNQGSGSAGTGFFTLFKQGTLGISNFGIVNPVPNEIIGINVNNINNSDSWLWELDTSGNYTSLWDQVPATSGNNVIYNSLNKSRRNIYSISTRDRDQIDLNFSDGVFGKLPNGQFQLFYRQSNGLSYNISPDQMSGISVAVPYIDKSGISQILTMILSLEYTVTNSAASESNTSIQKNAPQAFYTQNRMITAEDYSIAPLTYTTNVLKIKSVNRVSSGISKYFELSDVSGKYSKTNIFCDDGIIAKSASSADYTFSFYNQNNIWEMIKTYLLPKVLSSPEIQSFYLDNYRTYRPILVEPDSAKITWVQVGSPVVGQSRGYFQAPLLNLNSQDYYLRPIGVRQEPADLVNNPLYYVQAGSLIKFKAPKDAFGRDQYFLPDGTLTLSSLNASLYFWSNVQQVIGTGDNNGTGALDDGTGPIILTNTIPDRSAIVEIVPPFVTTLDYNFQSNIINLCLSYQSFGLRFDSTLRSWKIIFSGNLNKNFDLSNVGLSVMLDYEGDNSNANKDSSWLVLFDFQGEKTYKVTNKLTQYVFKSEKQTGFYLDDTNNNYDYVTNTIVKDKISVLSINAKPNSNYPLQRDYVWQITGTSTQSDGYVDPSLIFVGFYSNNSIVGNQKITIDPESFDNIVGTNPTVIDINGKSYVGRSGLKFQYEHNPSGNTRIDPAKSNIIDIYVLTKDYDLKFRNWLLTGSGSKPLPPTTQSLENTYSADLDAIKAISDQIIYQPASYKILFGEYADPNLQATFKVVRSPTSTISDNAIKSKVLDAINQFFALENWDFGQFFHFSELSAYIMNLLTPDITNFLLVPLSTNFGNLQEVACQSTEIFISGATTNNIKVISAVTPAQLEMGTY